MSTIKCICIHQDDALSQALVVAGAAVDAGSGPGAAHV